MAAKKKVAPTVKARLKTTPRPLTTAKKSTLRKAPSLKAKKTVKISAVSKVKRTPATPTKTTSQVTLDSIKAKTPPINDTLTKSQLITTIADMTGLIKRDVNFVFEALNEVFAAHLHKDGPREFTLPGIAKFTVVRKEASKARQGVNPFTGEMTTFKARPARDILKARLLKKAKDIVS